MDIASVIILNMDIASVIILTMDIASVIILTMDIASDWLRPGGEHSTSERRNLVKFNTSNHKLLVIELCRYQTDHMPRESRLCPLSKSNQVENETHFLLQCRTCSMQRETFFNQIQEIIPDIQRKTTSETITLLLNSTDFHLNNLVMKFMSSYMIVVTHRYYRIKMI